MNKRISQSNRARSALRQAVEDARSASEKLTRLTSRMRQEDFVRAVLCDDPDIDNEEQWSEWFAWQAGVKGIHKASVVLARITASGTANEDAHVDAAAQSAAEQVRVDQGLY